MVQCTRARTQADVLYTRTPKASFWEWSYALSTSQGFPITGWIERSCNLSTVFCRAWCFHPSPPPPPLPPPTPCSVSEPIIRYRDIQNFIYVIKLRRGIESSFGIIVGVGASQKTIYTYKICCENPTPAVSHFAHPYILLLQGGRSCDG